MNQLEIRDRLTRIETRVSQILIYLGGSIGRDIEHGGIKQTIIEALQEYDSSFDEGAAGDEIQGHSSHSCG